MNFQVDKLKHVIKNFFQKKKNNIKNKKECKFEDLTFISIFKK